MKGESGIKGDTGPKGHPGYQGPPGEVVSILSMHDFMCTCIACEEIYLVGKYHCENATQCT